MTQEVAAYARKTNAQTGGESGARKVEREAAVTSGRRNRIEIPRCM